MGGPTIDHRTVSLHELHVIGPDGLPARHRTIHVIRALRDGLESYTFRFDRREATVHAVRGVSYRADMSHVTGRWRRRRRPTGR